MSVTAETSETQVVTWDLRSTVNLFVLAALSPNLTAHTVEIPKRDRNCPI